MSNKINTSLNDVFKSTPLGDVDSAIGTLFYGINHRQTPNPVPINKDGYGLTFFTRPQLNLRTENIRAERTFIPLLTNEPESIQRIIRCYLDPRLNYDSNNSFGTTLVDHQGAFMPLLTNHLLACTGWPDPILETFTSKPGAYKEVYSMVDSSLDIYSAYDITATFRNMVGDPITSLFLYWLQYQASVFKGVMVPYPDFLVQNEIDYNTRIYRLVLDKNKRFVQKIACTGAAYPISVPIGGAFNFEAGKPINQTNDQIQINFRCMGACYQDDIVVHEFNKVVGIFNPSMRDEYYKLVMQQVPVEALSTFNSTGYPHINPDTYELCWYVPKDQYSRVMAAYERHVNSLK
jgi:hypothetical protein